MKPASVRAVADDVLQITLSARVEVHAYLLGDVLVDAGTSASLPQLLAALDGRAVAAHVVTHAHGDHIGGSAGVVERFGLEGIAVGAGDAPAARDGRQVFSRALSGRLLRRLGAGGFPPVAVTRRAVEGDLVGPGFVVRETPGHSAGHVVLWRERDRLLVCGDVLTTQHPLTGKPGLYEPPRPFTPDPRRNREAVRWLADLQPRTVCCGHGPVLRDAAAALSRLAANLA
ncbi:MBL fold metallo-hydrolase [Amycolatopsis benzoatilytica]|uniref:MBL fold metallo-hydrolase n=1 Tax=Amycolatopsis benzoatilytica TaxID=346045 RepID=UPI0003657CB1|nr:MBL fold metallo-hydrolase [Amycolatopsis benzoatilytica]